MPKAYNTGTARGKSLKVCNISLVILMKVSKCRIIRKISAWFTLMIRRGVAALLHYHPALKGEGS